MGFNINHLRKYKEMKHQLPNQNSFCKTGIKLFPTCSLPNFFNYPEALLLLLFTFFSWLSKAQKPGALLPPAVSFTPLTRLAPDANGGIMLLLSDGTVMAKTFSGGGDGIGNVWDRLTPDINGSYLNGTWSKTIAPMHSTRLYFSSQVLKDGRVYVAGGEYGSGGSLAETYNPLTNRWTNAPAPGQFISDANSEILPSGKVLQAIVSGNLRGNKIYDPVTNTYASAPDCNGIHNESAWVKLPDKSILFVDRGSTTSERYIFSTGTWVVDANVPVALYDPFGLETGAAFLLPDGRAFFLGSTGHTAYYTPSGTTSPGRWTAGPDIPNNQGTPDAAAAMMVNGNILCAVSPVPTSGNHFPSPTSYYTFNYRTNSFNRISAPGGGLTTNAPSYITNMLDLPNGQVLFSLQDFSQYYIFTPSGQPLAAGKPTIQNITKNGSIYTITGTGFNGISEGAGYGDDWQMATNYPIVRLRSGANVYYARTFNWNRTAVMTGSLPCSTQFTLPAGLPAGTYSLVVTANGIASDPVSFAYSPTAIASASTSAAQVNDNVFGNENEMMIYPNPAKNQTTIHLSLSKPSNVSLKVLDMSGKEIEILLNSNLQKGDHSMLLNTSYFSPGIYIVRMITENGIKNIRLVVQ